MIWEVDDDIDGVVSWKEYIKMYKWCTRDKENLEPRKLFNLVTFLMYDSSFWGRIIEEDTLQLLLVWHGRENLDNEIEHIFGSTNKQMITDEGEK